MSRVKQCDQCGNVDIGAAWLRLAGGNRVIFHAARPSRIYLAPLERDFCSKACLAAYANGDSDERYFARPEAATS